MRHRTARHAVDLALELGSNHVTLEAICERSTISHRTFYNHFDTKEAAIVGDGPTLPSEEALAAFHASDNDDILSDLLTAVISSHSGIGAGTDSDHELDRAILIRKEPSLTDPLGDQMTKVSNELTQHVLDRLTRHDPNGLFADPRIEAAQNLGPFRLLVWWPEHSRGCGARGYLGVPGRATV